MSTLEGKTPMLIGEKYPSLAHSLLLMNVSATFLAVLLEASVKPKKKPVLSGALWLAVLSASPRAWRFPLQ